MGLTYRQTKGSALTFQELDANFAYFTGSHPITGSLVVSGSQEIIGSQLITGSFNLTGSIATVVSGTEQLTGTQTIIGTQIITGSQYLTGSSVINGTLDVFGTVTMVSGSSIVIETQYITGSSIISGSQKISGSQDIFGTTTMTGSLEVSGSQQTIGTNTTVGTLVVTGTQQTTGTVEITGSLNVTGNVISTGSLILQPNISDVRYLEIYNTAAQDTHITASGGWLFLGDDTTYVKVDNYSTNNLIELRADNGITATGSLNVTGSQVYLTTDDFKVTLGDGITNLIVAQTSGVTIQDIAAYTSIDAQNRVLSDSTGVTSVNWNSRQLIKSDSITIAFDWENGALTSSLYGTASWAENALTASYVENAQTASYVANAVSASYSDTASYVETAQTASYVTLAQTSSYYVAPVVGSIPGGSAPEGTFQFVNDSGTYYIYAYVNGGWRSGSLV